MRDILGNSFGCSKSESEELGESPKYPAKNASHSYEHCQDLVVKYADVLCIDEAPANSWLALRLTNSRKPGILAQLNH